VIWLYAAISLAAVVLVGRLFLVSSPRGIAMALRFGVPLVACAAGMVLTALGRPLVGFPMVGLSVAAGLYLLGRPRRADPPRRRTMVRTAALEMELDLATGALEGSVLAGRHEGRRLGSLDRKALIALRSEFSSDPDSVRLLEAYLQSRFPAGSIDAEPDVGARKARPPAPRPMTEQEAYQILGLEAGASAADIRKAHRRLVQGLGSDVGSAAFLAARIDEARDVLLSLHG
jgi:hypothetical protein